MSEAIQTLRWRENANGGQLEMIDQTRLPATFEYLSYDSAEGVAHGIRTMVVRGAPAIGVAAAYGVALEALQLLLPNRHADPMDLLWMTLGASTGAFGSAYIFKLFAPSLPATSNP